MKAWLCLAIGALAHALTAPARADGVAVHRLRESDRAAAEAAFTAATTPSNAQVSTFHIAPSLALALRLGARWTSTLDATLGFTSFEQEARERRTSTRFGNPLLGFHLTLLAEPFRELRVGLAAAPPLVTTPGGLDANSAAAFADRVALQARGTQAPWLWSNNAIPLLALVSLREHLFSNVALRLDVQPGYLLSVNRRASRVALDVTARGELRAGRWVPEAAFHLYTQSVPILDGDYAQLSAAAALRYELAVAWLRAEFALNLDGPAGFGMHNRTPWGVTLASGARF
ncbi:MAG: hypothetical protein ACOY0T_05970 [Myxococcota bacterium]